MRWSYKTVHYELKKEGLLGSTFLDEAEIEESLNEFGHAGWELISLLEVKDGLIAVFKQSVDQAAVQTQLVYAKSKLAEDDPQDFQVEAADEQEPEREAEQQEDDLAFHVFPDQEIADVQSPSPNDKQDMVERSNDSAYGQDQWEAEDEQKQTQERVVGNIRIE